MAGTAENELEILAPDMEISVRGEPVTVHEYRFLEGMKAQRLAPGFFAAITALFLETPEEAQKLAVLADLFADHQEEVMQLIALATGQSPEWVANLSDLEGQQVMMAWWQVNAGFFTRRLVAAAASRIGTQQAATSQSTGAPYSPG